MDPVETPEAPVNLLEGPEFAAIVAAIVADEELRLELEDWLQAAA